MSLIGMRRKSNKEVFRAQADSKFITSVHSHSWLLSAFNRGVWVKAATSYFFQFLFSDYKEVGPRLWWDLLRLENDWKKKASAKTKSKSIFPVLTLIDQLVFQAFISIVIWTYHFPSFVTIAVPNPNLWVNGLSIRLRPCELVGFRTRKPFHWLWNCLIRLKAGNQTRIPVKSGLAGPAS